MPDIIFNGPAGRIEGRYHHNNDKDAPLALLLHPHPQHGGTMNNKVVYSLFHVFAKRGFSVLRFNFRGVGRSQGTFDRGEGELSDAASALDWMQQQNPDASHVWVAGFSFGSWIGMQLMMRRPEISSFVSVAPPANMYDFSFLAPCPASGLMVVGDKDDIVPSNAVEILAKKLQHQRDIEIDFQMIPDADHFFTDQRDDLGEIINAYLNSAIDKLPEKQVARKGRRKQSS